MTGFWPSPDGVLPKEEPECGFRNERCDYTIIIVAGSIMLLLFFGVLMTLVMIRVCMEKGEVPTARWRQAFLTPITKKTWSNYTNNYCRVSIYLRFGF
ncbi:unnamed protein product [Nippostrongylus brasiliensis]|uniref:Agrin Agrin N-terminal 110 kDa subunit n=1 Tax=Nippostrongylus brasiliensis TaxID=27835 RepID=A0A0N4XPC0_NIPBR|nr:unnamed protein product [Nippostrongylus brasiliensis]